MSEVDDSVFVHFLSSLPEDTLKTWSDRMDATVVNNPSLFDKLITMFATEYNKRLGALKSFPEKYTREQMDKEFYNYTMDVMHAQFKLRHNRIKRNTLIRMIRSLNSGIRRTAKRPLPKSPLSKTLRRKKRL